MQVLRIIPEHAEPHLSSVRELFVEYANSLETELCFQNFNQELAELPGRYAPPAGSLFLALRQSDTAGCVALRATEPGICEMKRLYVRPAFRRTGLGRLLAQRDIDAAREAGYRTIRLDTLPTMIEAIALYESLGFSRIQPYYDNPHACAVFMERAL